MTVEFRASFTKDLETLRDVRLLHRVEKVLRTLERAGSPADVPQLKRLQGHPHFFRIRIGDFRFVLIEVFRSRLAPLIAAVEAGQPHRRNPLTDWLMGICFFTVRGPATPACGKRHDAKNFHKPRRFCSPSH